MRSEKNLFVISTPSQAFFLSQTPHLIESDSILIITKSKNGYEKKILYYLKQYHWKKIIIIDVTKIENFRGYYKILIFSIYINFLFKVKYRNVKNLFIGSYHNPFHLGIAGILENKSSLYLLYDGLQMVSVMEERRGKLPFKIRAYTKIFTLFGFLTPALKSLTFITPIYLPISPRDKIIIIQPPVYDHPLLQEGLIYFVGQPLVDVGILSLSNYISKLLQVKEKFINSIVIYIPHPKESEIILKQIEIHFNIQYFDVIFEEKYITSNLFSKSVVSFYSSVLINLCFLKAETNIYAVEIFPEEIIKKIRNENISQVYHFLKNIRYHKFKVLELP